MDPVTNYKICPRCGKKDHLLAPHCQGCGREYKTRIVPEMERTQMLPPSLAQDWKPAPTKMPEKRTPQRFFQMIVVTLLFIMLVCAIVWAREISPAITEGALIGFGLTGGMLLILLLPSVQKRLSLWSDSRQQPPIQDEL